MARTFKGMANAKHAAEAAAERLTSERVVEIDNDKIIDNPLNKNIPIGDVEELAREIDEIGQQEPAVVYDMGDGTYMLVAGHRRRYAKCVINGDKTLSCIVKPYPADPMVRFREHASTNIYTRDKDVHFWLSELDNAREVLKEMGFSGGAEEEKEKLSSMLGKGMSVAQIARYDGFRKLVPELQELTDYGLSVATLYLAVGLTEDQQRQLAKNLIGRYKANPDLTVSRADFTKLVRFIKDAEEVKPRTRRTYSSKVTEQYGGLIRSLRSAKTDDEKEAARKVVEDLRRQLDELDEYLT